MKEIAAVGIGLFFWLISGIRLKTIRENEYCLEITTTNHSRIHLMFAINSKEANDLRLNARLNRDTGNHLQHAFELNITLQVSMASQQLNN